MKPNQIFRVKGSAQFSLLERRGKHDQKRGPLKELVSASEKPQGRFQGIRGFWEMHDS